MTDPYGEDPELDAWLDEKDMELPDDFFVVNGADRDYNGRFIVWYKRRHYADGRDPLPPETKDVGIEKIRFLCDLAMSNYAADWLPALAAMQREIQRVQYEVVALVRGYGWPWREIANALDISTASAHRRYGQLEFDLRRRWPPQAPG